MDDKELGWLGSSFKDLCAMPSDIRRDMGHALRQLQNGLRPTNAKALSGFRPTSAEILADHQGNTYRLVYTTHYAAILYVVHCFKKKSTKDSNLPKPDRETIELRLSSASRLEGVKAAANKTAAKRKRR